MKIACSNLLPHSAILHLCHSRNKEVPQSRFQNLRVISPGFVVLSLCLSSWPMQYSRTLQKPICRHMHLYLSYGNLGKMGMIGKMMIFHPESISIQLWCFRCFLPLATGALPRDRSSREICSKFGSLTFEMTMMTTMMMMMILGCLIYIIS